VGAADHWGDTSVGRNDCQATFGASIPRMPRVAVLIAVASALLAAEARGQFLLWSDAETTALYRARVDGTDRRVLFADANPGSYAGPFAVDEKTGTVYWGVGNQFTREYSLHLVSINGGLLGTHPLAPPTHPRGSYATSSMALDSDGLLTAGTAKLYCGGDEDFWTTDLDGANPTPLFRAVNDDPTVLAIALDFDARRVYWASADS
jgi:hypothetical protein